jgi:hypothetical protein
MNIDPELSLAIDNRFASKRWTRPVDWIADTRSSSERFGVRVVNLYSGHGACAALGLSHTDERVRIRFRDRWVKAHANTPRQLDAGPGFFAHAIPDPVLQEPGVYHRCLEELYRNLANLASYAAQIGLPSIGVEQMYSPASLHGPSRGQRRCWKRCIRPHRFRST